MPEHITLDDDAITGKIYDARLARRVLAYARPYRGLAVLSVVLVAASTALFVVSPWLVGRVVDEGIVRGDERAVIRIALLYVVVEVLRFLTTYAQTYYLSLLGQRIMFDLRMELTRSLLARPIWFYERHPVGRLVTRATNDIQSLVEVFSSGVVVVFGDAVLVVGIACVMLVLDPHLAALAILPIPLVIGAIAFVRAHLRDAYRDVRQRLARINAHLAESLAGIRIIQIFCRERRNEEAFGVKNDDHLVANMRSVRWHAILSSAITIFSAAAIVMVLGFGGRRVLAGAMELGVLVAFIAYTQSIFQPIRDISEKWNIFQSAMASAERIFRLLDDPAHLPERAGASPPREPRGAVLLDDVWFRYGTEEGAAPAPSTAGGNGDDAAALAGEEVEAAPLPVEAATDGYALRGVTLDVPAGESVAVVGATGAGKSTLVKLLLRFHDATRGRVTVDGLDVRDWPVLGLRRSIAVVHQDVFLFAGNVRENIRLWNEAVDDAHIVEACRLVRADAVLARLPGGLDAEVAEGGLNLSVGEKQLLSFARALVLDPRILVLDEATSSVDGETEALIQEGTAALIAGRTSFVIAHRLSTIRHCHRIVCLHRGEVREVGNHEDLLARNGIYAKLYRLQVRGNGAAAGVRGAAAVAEGAPGQGG